MVENETLVDCVPKIIKYIVSITKKKECLEKKYIFHLRKIR